MRKSSFLFITLLFISTIFSENSLALSLTPLENRVKQLKVTNTKEFFFKQVRSLSSLNIELISTGRITVTPVGLTQETLLPRYSWISFDSTGVYTKKDSLDSKTKIKDSFSTIMSNFFSTIFAGDIELLYKSFTTEYNEKELTWSIILTPKEKDVARIISSINLLGTDELNSIHIITNSGDSTLLSFTKVSFE